VTVTADQRIGHNEYLSNFYILRIYQSLGIFTAIFVSIYTSFMEI